MNSVVLESSRYLSLPKWLSWQNGLKWAKRIFSVSFFFQVWVISALPICSHSAQISLTHTSEKQKAVRGSGLRGPDKLGELEVGIGELLPEDPHLWLLTCPIQSDRDMMDANLLASGWRGCVKSQQKSPNPEDKKAVALLPCSLAWSQGRPQWENDKLLFSLQSCSAVNNNWLYFKPGSRHLM